MRKRQYGGTKAVALHAREIARVLEASENPVPESDAGDSNPGSVDDLIRQVGNRVRDTRKSLRMSRRELSERSGVSPRYLAKLECGDGNISIGLLKKVATALATPIERFVMQPNDQSVETAHVCELYQRADAATQAQVLQILDPDRTCVHKADRVCLVGLRGCLLDGVLFLVYCLN